MITNRELFLNNLQAVQSGLTQIKDTTEQSTCFVFQDGKVMTFNGEVANVRPLGFNSIHGAVVGAKLLNVLQKFPGDCVDLKVKDGHLVLSPVKNGKAVGRKAGIIMSADISMPIDEVEKADNWKELPDSFGDAINTVQVCAGTDDTFFYLTCVHVHPKYVEAYDNYQACRWTFDEGTGISEPALVKRDSIKALVPLGVTHMSESPHWLHFKNNAGQVFSCMRYTGEFPDTDDYFAVGGEKVALPKAIIQACDCANEFSQDTSEDNLIQIDLQPPNRLLVTSVGAYGWYRHPITQISYNGPPIKFLIPPAVLSDIAKRHSECFLSDKAILVEGGPYKYCTRLTAPNNKESQEDEE